MLKPKIDPWFKNLPKVELHLHLEGAIPLPTLWELVRKYAGETAVPTLQALENKFQFRDFPHFIETWTWKNQFLREYDDFTLIAEAVARDLASQNIRYAEVFYSPSDFLRHNLNLPGLTAAIRSGLSKVPEIQINLVCDLVRDRGLKNAESNLAEINEVKNLGVVGITIGGSEQDYPPELFAGVYTQARSMGLYTSAHAGEAAGASSIWGAIRGLKVDRIGHGARAIEDPELVEYLVEHQIPLEICPISNVKTRVVESLKNHPVRTYFKKGLSINISTDDPMMFGNSLAAEYAGLVNELGFSRDDIKSLILNGVRSAWLPDESKKQLIQKFKNSP